jgi:AraC family transcriptional regulator, regulatory protein of adaptative response / DNA-3-methyladenine glycosylase II
MTSAEIEATTTFLAARAVPGIEDAADGGYRRTLRLPHGPAVIGLDRVVAADPRDRDEAERARRRLAGADPSAADAHLAGDAHLGPLIAARPGLRMPGAVDGAELAVRAVLGQQVSLAAARTLAGRLVAMAGEPLPEPVGALTHVWPRPEAIAEAAPSMPMPRSRQNALAALATAIADGLRLDPGEDAPDAAAGPRVVASEVRAAEPRVVPSEVRAAEPRVVASEVRAAEPRVVASEVRAAEPRVVPSEVRAALLELPGIGPWTAEYVVMRALGEPDAWLPTDLGVRHGLARIGATADAAEAWRPHRTHAVRHLWAA